MLSEQPSGGVATLEDYLEALRTRWFIIVLAALLGGLFGYLIDASSTDQYSANARVVVNPTPVGSIDARLVAPTLEREVEVIISDEIAERAAEALDGDRDAAVLRRDVQAQFVPNSDVLRLTYTSVDQIAAAQVTNAFAESYVASRIEEQQVFFDSQLTSVTESLADLDAQIDVLSVRLTELEADRVRLLAQPASPERTSDLDAITTERQPLNTQFNALQSERRFAAADLRAVNTSQATQGPAAEFLRRAAVPSSANGLPASVLIVGLGLVGLLFGAVAAFLASRLDRSANSEIDVALALSTQVLGSIPKLGWRNRPAVVGPAMITPRKTVALQRARESFRRTRSAIQFLSSDSNAKTFLFTSHEPAEGKSITVTNLAVALAQSGSTVALISADMRRPTVESLLGVDNSKGLSTFLGGFDETLVSHQVPGLEALTVVPAGPEPANPGELLGSSGFRHLVDSVEESFDYVLIDTPPVSAAADAMAAGNAADGAIIVVDVTKTSTTALLQVRSELDRSGVTVAGAILNKKKPAQRWWNRSSYSYYDSPSTK